jgi:hypothetical protein
MVRVARYLVEAQLLACWFGSQQGSFGIDRMLMVDALHPHELYTTSFESVERARSVPSARHGTIVIVSVHEQSRTAYIARGKGDNDQGEQHARHDKRNFFQVSPLFEPLL